MQQISILSLFPEMFENVFGLSIIKRAKEKGLIGINLINLRDFATDKYKSVDDRVYGGGPGMILRIDVVDRALTYIRKSSKHKTRVILLDPQGKKYDQKKAKELSKHDSLILVCGHYEGVDERIRHLVDEEISIGDYVLTGGEIPAMALVDSIVRLIPGVLTNENATISESFSSPQCTLEGPQYTRPKIYHNLSVPDVLLGGDHAKISIWRQNEANKRTRQRRPDLLKKKK